MSTIYELSPRVDLPYAERQEHWPKDQIIPVQCIVIAGSEDRAREIAATRTRNPAWAKPSLTQARQVSEREYFLGSV